jgi:hypothetical protein
VPSSGGRNSFLAGAVQAELNQKNKYLKMPMLLVVRFKQMQFALLTVGAEKHRKRPAGCLENGTLRAVRIVLDFISVSTREWQEPCEV